MTKKKNESSAFCDVMNFVVDFGAKVKRPRLKKHAEHTKQEACKIRVNTMNGVLRYTRQATGKHLIRRVFVARKVALSESLNCRCLTSTTSSNPTSNPRKSIGNEVTTHFGYKTVNIEEKEERVQQVFANVAQQYDVMNDVMSGGLHRFWKDALVQKTCVSTMAGLIRRQQQQQMQSDGLEQEEKSLEILDVAGGTGDIAFRLYEAADCVERAQSSGRDPVRITVADLNSQMLQVGHERAQKLYNYQYNEPTFAPDKSTETNKDLGTNAGAASALSFIEANAQELPFEDNTFDVYTISFGLRNVTHIDRALAEAHRVLKPGGHFLCLEFSQPFALLRPFYDLYSFQVIPAMGQVVANDGASYQYLVESIRRFPNQVQLQQRMQDAGMVLTKFTNYTGGIVAIHEGWKAVHHDNR